MARQGVRLLALTQVGAHCQLLQAQGGGVMTFAEDGRRDNRVAAWTVGNKCKSKEVAGASAAEMPESQTWDNNDFWGFEEGDEAASPHAGVRDALRCGHGEEGVLKHGLSACFLFDGARGAITDLHSCLDRAVRNLIEVKTGVGALM